MGKIAYLSRGNEICNSRPTNYQTYLLFPGVRYHQVSEAELGSFEELALPFVPEEEGAIMIYTANLAAKGHPRQV